MTFGYLKPFQILALPSPVHLDGRHMVGGARLVGDRERLSLYRQRSQLPARHHHLRAVHLPAESPSDGHAIVSCTIQNVSAVAEL